MPTSAENTNARRIDRGLTCVAQFAKCEMSSDAVNPTTIPITPPSRESVTASTRNCNRMSRVLAPTNIFLPIAGRAQLLGVDSRKLAGKDFDRIGYVSENQDLPDAMTAGGLLDYMRPFY